MTNCPLYPGCGGCLSRDFEEKEYRQQKYDSFQHIINHIHQNKIIYGTPIFIADGTRRRASLTFNYLKKQLTLGFNAPQSHKIINCELCPLLTEKINKNLMNIRKLLQAVCSEPYILKKGKKTISQIPSEGEILICEADNGIDILLEMNFEPELAHRLAVSEQMSQFEDLIRLSWRNGKNKMPETIFEKAKPILENSGVKVYIPAGTFLQASQAGEQALINLVLKYVGQREGNIADLFCGVGTFSYPLAQHKNNQILAIDSCAELLDGFRQSVNRNQILNIKIESKNLFKYPLDEKELAKLDIVIFDPPRAGAAAQVSKLATCSDGPQTVVAVSCNPHTFVNDANKLLEGGYTLKEITMVDQFIYSSHTELVALFEKDVK